MNISAVLGNTFTQILLLVLFPIAFPFFRYVAINLVGEKAQKWYHQLVEFPKSYTIGALKNLIKIPILFITGCYAKNPQIRFVREERGESGVKCLTLKGYVKPLTENWWNPFIILGRYICNLIHNLLGPAVASIVCMVALPNAFANLVDGFDQWLALSSGTPNADYFVRMFYTFKDLTYDRFIITGLNTNVILLLLCGVVFIFMSGSYVEIIKQDTKEINKSTFITWGSLSVMLIIYNIVHALVDYTSYIVVADVLAKVGIATLFILLINFIIDILVWCSNFIVSIVNKLK